jgi:hypothetical protein
MANQHNEDERADASQNRGEWVMDGKYWKWIPEAGEISYDEACDERSYGEPDDASQNRIEVEEQISEIEERIQELQNERESLLEELGETSSDSRAEKVLSACVLWRMAVVAPHRHNLNKAEIDLAIAIDCWMKGGVK